VKAVLVKDALARTYTDVGRKHTLQMAASLAYYFVLSLFPGLIFLSASVFTSGTSPTSTRLTERLVRPLR
jgi:uncharacterized BrkB/YihY/UPF0761 family membrane protein